ncbi:hypothetical protein [Nitrincola nitratireducens]|nr:hypothetical protein [Nitrincola nitratireducens]
MLDIKDRLQADGVILDGLMLLNPAFKQGSTFAIQAQMTNEKP